MTEPTAPTPADDLLSEFPNIVDWPDDYDEDAYTADPETLALPTVDLDELAETNPADDQPWQDDVAAVVEGLGAPADQPIWRRAVPRAREKVGHPNEVGYCLQEIREINETQPGALDARGSLLMCDWVVRIRSAGDWRRVPKGSIGYFDSPASPHGHIYENMGDGIIVSTDVPTGVWGRLPGQDLMDRWYPASRGGKAFWGPQVNHNTVGEWTRRGAVVHHGPTPRTLRLRQLRAWREQLDAALREARNHDDHDRVKRIQFRLATVEAVIRRLVKAKQ